MMQKILIRIDLVLPMQEANKCDRVARLLDFIVACHHITTVENHVNYVNHIIL